MAEVHNPFAMIMKDRARKPTALGQLFSCGTGIAPYGVGGFPTNEPCVSFQIGDHRVILTHSAWKSLNKSFRSLGVEIG